ncbi:MAG: hypothetical protein OEZ06_26015 [Myxococcales bacterium]|nr:hypothetical protein [Myxococcales bacterium]
MTLSLAALLLGLGNACGTASHLSDEPLDQLPGNRSADEILGTAEGSDSNGDSALTGSAAGDAGASEASDGSRPPCGNATETCDPNDLGGATCDTLGMGEGRLLCDPATCTFDVSMCGSGGNTGSGGSGGGDTGGQMGPSQEQIAAFFEMIQQQQQQQQQNSSDAGTDGGSGN